MDEVVGLSVFLYIVVVVDEVMADAVEDTRVVLSSNVLPATVLMPALVVVMVVVAVLDGMVVVVVVLVTMGSLVVAEVLSEMALGKRGYEGQQEQRSP